MVRPMENDFTPGVSTSAGAVGALSRTCCPNCKLPLPLRTARNDEQPAAWECGACRCRMVGLFVPELAATMAEHVRLGQVHLDAYSLPPIPPVLRELTFRREELSRGERVGQDRRRDHRFGVQDEATVACLNERWVPQGQPIRALVVELSPGGMRLISRSNIRSPLVDVQMTEASGSAQYVAKTVWYDHLGCGFHHVGIEFIHRLGR